MEGRFPKSRDMKSMNFMLFMFPAFKKACLTPEPRSLPRRRAV
jgi:hypothetical protein